MFGPFLDLFDLSDVTALRRALIPWGGAIPEPTEDHPWPYLTHRTNSAPLLPEWASGGDRCVPERNVQERCRPSMAERLRSWGGQALGRLKNVYRADEPAMTLRRLGS